MRSPMRINPEEAIALAIGCVAWADSGPLEDFVLAKIAYYATYKKAGHSEPRKVPSYEMAKLLNEIDSALKRGLLERKDGKLWPTSKQHQDARAVGVLILDKPTKQ